MATHPTHPWPPAGAAMPVDERVRAAAAGGDVE